jgi:hypothetical protein
MTKPAIWSSLMATRVPPVHRLGMIGGHRSGRTADSGHVVAVGLGRYPPQHIDIAVLSAVDRHHRPARMGALQPLHRYR